MTNLKEIEKVAAEMNYDLIAVGKALKSVASAKCRLKKMPFKANYDDEMTEILKKEQVLKQVRQLLDPKEKPVPMYELEDVKRLDYDQTMKALKSIQSKKTLSKHLTEVPGDNDEYRNACRVEKMLQEHRDSIKPVDDEYIRKTDLVTIIDTIKETADIKVSTILELLETLV